MVNNITVRVYSVVALVSHRSFVNIGKNITEESYKMANEPLPEITPGEKDVIPIVDLPKKESPKKVSPRKKVSLLSYLLSFPVFGLGKSIEYIGYTVSTISYILNSLIIILILYVIIKWRND